MAELVVRVPGQPERVVPLAEKGVVVGRGEDCDAQVLEVRASKRHLAIAPFLGPDGKTVWVANDLHSSNGTTLAGERILRRGLAAGDVLKVGETTIEFRESAPAAPAAAGPAVVSGRLKIERVVPGAPAAAAVPA